MTDDFSGKFLKGIPAPILPPWIASLEDVSSLQAHSGKGSHREEPRRLAYSSGYHVCETEPLGLVKPLGDCSLADPELFLTRTHKPDHMTKLFLNS